MSLASRAFAEGRLLSTQVLAPGVFEIAAAWEGPAPLPGQFFMVRALRSGVLLGRPLSVSGTAHGSVSFVVAERGPGTKELSALMPGDRLRLEGPLGSSWPDLSAGRGGPLALIGGGVGLAPLVFLAKNLTPNSYDLYAGYRSGSWGLEGLAPRALRVFTEDGSAGSRGRVLDGFAAAGYGALLACGPEPMLRSVASLAAAAAVPAWLSLERRMACGVGACLGCSVRTRSGNRRACVEGPVFTASEVLFDD